MRRPAGAPGVTVTVAEPVTLPDVARMTALPLQLPLIKPVELTVAMSVFELDQETFEAGEPSRVAVACTVVPDAMLFSARVTVMRGGGGAVDDDPDPPQAAKISGTLASIAGTERIARLLDAPPYPFSPP